MLCLDTIAASARRELNETFPSFAQRYLPKYGRPHVDRIANLPVAIRIDQRKPAPNVRSAVGTNTDTYSLLRLLFSRTVSYAFATRFPGKVFEEIFGAPCVLSARGAVAETQPFGFEKRGS